MRVLLATSLSRGGPVEHSLVLAKALSGAGAAVEAICADAEVADRFEAAGAEPAVIPLRHLGDVAGGARVRKVARRADVVHSQDRRSGLWTRIWPQRKGEVRVYTAHGLPDPFLPPPIGSGGRPKPRDEVAYRGVDAWLARRSDAVVVPSRFLADELVLRIGYPQQRIEVIPNGIEPRLLDSPGAQVGSISMLEPVKSLDTFVRAAGAIVERRPSTRFSIFGEGSQRDELEGLVRTHRLDEAFEFPGHVPVHEALATLSVYVLCSLLENCPMSLLEAMGAGVPAVATEVGGVAEIAGEAVLLVPPRDHEELAAAVLRLLDDAPLATGMAKSARRRVEENFTADRNAERLLGLYERLIAARS
jgi:glycosyltransferase involved in cell wall biosynthesis